jgi:AraC family transcriptional regulator
MTASLTFNADAYRGGMRQRPHSHDELHLSLVLRGHVTESVGGKTEYAGALAVVAKDAGVVHANDFGTSGAHLARLSLAGGTIGSLIDDPARSQEWHWTHEARVARPFLRLVRRARGSTPIFEADDTDLADLLAALTARSAAPTRGQPPVWLAETVARLREEWSPTTCVADVARWAGVHPVYLARVMRRWYGTSVGEELRRLRLRAAVAALGFRATTVSEIAHQYRFADEPHLCRSLQASIGLTPGTYRALVNGTRWRRRGRVDQVAEIQARRAAI